MRLRLDFFHLNFRNIFNVNVKDQKVNWSEQYQINQTCPIEHWSPCTHCFFKGPKQRIDLQKMGIRLPKIGLNRLKQEQYTYIFTIIPKTMYVEQFLIMPTNHKNEWYAEQACNKSNDGTRQVEYRVGLLFSNRKQITIQ